MRASVPTLHQKSTTVQRSTHVRLSRNFAVAGLTEVIMNKPDVQHGAQGAANNQDLAAASKHGPTESSSQPEMSGAEVAPAVAESGSETVSMGSPAFGLDGKPVSKDAIHLNT
jgi:hypothetical protein